MPNQPSGIAEEIRALLESQRYAVLGTAGASGVLLNLMAYACTHDLRYLYVAAERSTAKYANILRDPRVSLLVDNRANQPDDTAAALALTISGLARELAGVERAAAEVLFLARHPQMADFVRAADCALLQVDAARYELIRGLRGPVSWEP